MLFKLFLSFLQVGMFSFGGGYAAMPLIQSEVVYKNGWLSMEQFTDLITISEMTPGPIAVNSASFVGLQVAGFPGAVVATLGCILPACIFVTLIAKLYIKYRSMSMLQSVLGCIRPAVVALIASAGILILVSAFWGGMDNISFEATRWPMVGIFLICLLLLRKTKLSPIVIMFSAGFMKLLLSSLGV